jgi:protein involved in polysaccharide export with SLBB domain
VVSLLEIEEEKGRAMKRKLVMFNCLIFPLVIILAGCGGKDLSPPFSVESPVSKEVMGDYYLQPGDNLDVKFFYNPELNENVTIRPDGKISLQLIDEIQAAGLTPKQLDEIITKEYSSLLKEPLTAVILKSFGGQRIYVGGEVNSPQVLKVVGKINALQAIFDAGGFRDNAKLSKVIIVSRGHDNLPLVREVNLKNALKGELSEKEYLLKPFDMVYVPKTNLAKSSEFITQIYKFIPPRVGLSFQYELHNEPNKTKTRTEPID